jgi:hypothetical protein
MVYYLVELRAISGRVSSTVQDVDPVWRFCGGRTLPVPVSSTSVAISLYVLAGALGRHHGAGAGTLVKTEHQKNDDPSASIPHDISYTTQPASLMHNISWQALGATNEPNRVSFTRNWQG